MVCLLTLLVDFFASTCSCQWLDCMYWATFENWVNFSKIWARFVFGQIFLKSGQKLTFSGQNFFPTHLNWPINLFSSLHEKNTVLRHLKFLRKFYPQKFCPIHAVQPILEFPHGENLQHCTFELGEKLIRQHVCL